jgi:hypothetical protein
LHAYAIDPLMFAHAATLFRAPPSPTAGSLIKSEPDTVIWAQDVGAERRAILKMYRHRGPVTTLRERTFRFRVQREFEALHHLQWWGIPCSEPIAWAHGHSAEHGRFEILATWEVAEAKSLRALADVTRAENIQWDLSSLYRNLRPMHESGMFHGVLHLRNVLAGRDETGERGFYIIDTPGALLYPGSIVGTSMALFDLLLFSSQAVRHLGIAESDLPLEAYGMDEPSLKALRSRLPGFHPTRFDRQLIKAVAALRLIGARRGGARLRSSYRRVN